MKSIPTRKSKFFLLIKFLVILVLVFIAVNFLATFIFGLSLSRLPVIRNIPNPIEFYRCYSKNGYYHYDQLWNHYNCTLPGTGLELMPLKPVIYLYPQKEIKVKVLVNYQPGFSVSYPTYNNGWEVLAYPDAKIISKDGKEFSYLYWEGNPDQNATYDLSTGFVVKGNETADFLQTKLKEIGLNSKEYNEFIVYWLPKMIHNSYNLIHFASNEEYSNRAEMQITPKPDSLLRVFMVFKPLSNEVQIKPQTFGSFQRKGFTVIEWGGAETK